MKECIQCGAVLDELDTKCQYCGQPVDAQNYTDAAPQDVPSSVFDIPAAPSIFDNDRQPVQPQQNGQPAQPQYAPAQYGSQPQYNGQPAQPQYNPAQYGSQPQYGGQPAQPQYNPAQYGNQPQYNGQPAQPQYNPAQYGNQPQYNGQPMQYYDPAMYKDKSKIAAGLLGILLGNIGVHKFYLGNIGLGIVYILFCWTCIPGIIGLIEGIIYLTMTDDDFREKYCRIYK